MINSKTPPAEGLDQPLVIRMPSGWCFFVGISLESAQIL